MGDDISNDKAPSVWSKVSLHWYHWTVLSFSLILTFGAWYVTDQQVQQKTQARFEFQSNQIINLVRERMEKYEEALWAGVAALHMQSKPSDRSSWKEFAESLKVEERYPGVNGVGVIHYVPTAKLENYLAWQRKELPAYKIHPPHEHKEYWPISYIEPQSNNAKAVGLDMAHEKNRYTAAQRSRDRNEAQITGPITLVQDSKQTPGFLFYVPWFSNNEVPLEYGDDSGFLGLVYAPFIMNNLMDGVLYNENRLIHFDILDGDTKLYSELNIKSESFDQSPVFSKTVEMDIYGRNWKFQVQTSNLFREQFGSSQPTMILIGGILIDGLLFLIFLILSRSNRRAIEYANIVTRELKNKHKDLEDVQHNLQRRNLELEEANSELDQFAFVASHDLKAPLRGISQLVGWIEEDTKGYLTRDIENFFFLLKNRVQRLESLLDDLLEYSRIGRKEGSLQKVDIKSKVNEIFDLFNPRDDVSFTLDCNIKEITTMITPLEQIIRNLISNSFKHNDKKICKIHIKINKLDDYYLFSFKDNGPGIPVEHRSRVFDLFHTLKPRDEIEGSGLGLSIVKKILDRYGSNYEISSEDGSGCLFIFTWPLDDEIKRII